VWGYSPNVGVQGSSSEGVGVQGSCGSVGPGRPPIPGRYGVQGLARSRIGVIGSSDTFIGVQGTSSTSVGVQGYSPDGYGVRGDSNSGFGVLGRTGGLFSAVDGSNTGSGTGVSGRSSGIAVSGVSSGSGHGVYGRRLAGQPGYGGFFDGGINVINGNKNFQIDHPLDPENRYLLHTCVESSERKNVYDGVAQLDVEGAAWVDLPEWFEALNGDLRYQLTAVGQAAPNLHVAEEIYENRFKIAGGKEGMKVCWQVTGSRKDAWAAANPFEVEQEKPEEERGRYLEPSLYDAPEEQRVMIGPIAEAMEAEQRPPEPSGIDFAGLEEEHRRQIEELRRLEEEQEEQRRLMEERQEEAPPEST
jgi:hypothetical protein